ncbi:MAG: hypothetical protein JSU06_10620 [Actinobacteria bacterium]|nr:hypothetical protein [Actinomycetota bacterium]
MPRRLFALALLATAALALTAGRAKAAGETLTLVQNDPTAVVGQATNFTASGTLNPEDTMFGFDIYIFVKNAASDPTCAPNFETESANAMHSGGNESWVSPAGGFQVGTGPSFSQPFKITFTGPGTYLLCGYVNGDFSTFATAHLSGNVTAGSTGTSTPGSTQGSVPPAPTAAAPAAVRAPWITRRGNTLTCHPGSWSGAPTGIGYGWYVDGRGKSVSSASTMAVRRSLRGHRVVCRVTAANAAGSKTASSRPVRVG